MSIYLLKYYRITETGYIPSADTKMVSRTEALRVKGYAQTWMTHKKPSSYKVKTETRELQVIDGAVYAPLSIVGAAEKIRKEAPHLHVIEVDDRY